MATVGLCVRLIAAPGKESEVEAFLEGAVRLVDAEPETTAWFAARVDPSTFLIFDVFPTESGREGHPASPVAEALAARAADRQRPHRALDLKPPNPPEPTLPAFAEIQRRDRLGGLIHEYYRAAA